MFRNPTADLLVVLLIVLLIFGPKRLPTLGKQLGAGLREFKESITGESKDDDEDERPAITQTSATPVVTPGRETVEAAPAPGAPARESADVVSEKRP